MSRRPRAVAVARGAALFFAVAAITALVLWTQTREVRRTHRAAPSPAAVRPASAPAPVPTPGVAVEPESDPTPGVAVEPESDPTPGVAVEPESDPTPGVAVEPESDPTATPTSPVALTPEPATAPEPTAPTPPASERRVFFSTSKAMMAPSLDAPTVVDDVSQQAQP